MIKILMTVFAAFVIAVACTKKKTEEEDSVGGTPATGAPRNVHAKPASLDAWLSERPTIKAAIKMERSSGGSSYVVGGTLSENGWDDWSEEERQAVRDAFDRQWTWLYETADHANSLGSDEFALPIACSNCATNLGSNPGGSPMTIITPATAASLYYAQLAHALALEAGGALPWSVASDSSAQLHHFFNSRAVMHRYGSNYLVGPPNVTLNERIKNIGSVSPATPRWTYAWMLRNGMIRSTKTETIHAFLQWARENLTHFYNAASYANNNDHWLTPQRPPVERVLQGTTSTSYGFRYWTEGCHGTAGLVKAVMRVLNIPVEVLYVCGHAQIYFPTEGKYIDHGDNPYSADVRTNTARPISELLIDQATHTSWFSASPDFLPAGNPLCDNIGRQADGF